MTLYLASASPRRSQLLAEAGIAFERVVVPIDEEALTETYHGPLEMLGEYLARQKALAAWEHLDDPTACVLASDTTVLIDGRSLAKPRDADEARAMLAALRGREHTVATGVALASATGLIAGTSATRVLMRAYTDEEIAAYVATGDPLDKAGAYSIQHPSFQPVARITGCHLGVIGLPVCLVAALLGAWPEDAEDTDFFNAEDAEGRTQRAQREEGKERDSSLRPLRPLSASSALKTPYPLCPWSSRCQPPLPPVTALRRVSSSDGRGEP